MVVQVRKSGWSDVFVKMIIVMILIIVSYQFCYVNHSLPVDTYIISDIRSFVHILTERLITQYPILGSPVFTQLLTRSITNAVICHLSPLLQGMIFNRYDMKNKAFVKAVQDFRMANPEGFELPDVLCQDSPEVDAFLERIDATLELSSPLAKIQGYQSILGV